MPTQPQIEANRRNAQSSTGPRTAEGKSRSSQNAEKSGLFSTRNCVLPGEQDEYDTLCQSLWNRLRPADVLEEVYATEILRATWRLRRCALVEATLALNAGIEEQRAADRDFAYRNPQAAQNGEKAPKLPVGDPVLYSYLLPVQTSVDRARSRAFGVLNRAVAELRRLQSERQSLDETLPLQNEPAAESHAAEPAQTGPIRAATACPCNSGLQHQHCCGFAVRATPPATPATLYRNAPAIPRNEGASVLHQTA